MRRAHGDRPRDDRRRGGGPHETLRPRNATNRKDDIVTRQRRFGIAVLCGAAVIYAASAGVAAQGPTVLTLAQAVDEALVKNDRLINQHDTTTQADLGLRLARNTFRPKITPNIFGSFGRTDISSQTYRVDVSQKIVTGTELRLGIGTVSAQIPDTFGRQGDDVLFYNADTTLTLTQPLLRGFGRTV